MLQIAPSLLSADFSCLQKEIVSLEAAGADIIHLDIMDGHFVPNLTFGAPVVKMLRSHTNLIFDVHLMVTNPSNYISSLSEAGVNMISFHWETEPHADRLVTLIKEKNMLAGIALNPATSVAVLTDILPMLDFVLLMSVNPGFGGQKFIPYCISKTETLKELIAKTGKDISIEVDGGVTPENSSLLRNAGADILVAGSAIFSSSNRAETIAALRGI